MLQRWHVATSWQGVIKTVMRAILKSVKSICQCIAAYTRSHPERSAGERHSTQQQQLTRGKEVWKLTCEIHPPHLWRPCHPQCPESSGKVQFRAWAGCDLARRQFLCTHTHTHTYKYGNSCLVGYVTRCYSHFHGLFFSAAFFPLEWHLRGLLWSLPDERMEKTTKLRPHGEKKDYKAQTPWREKRL